MDIHAEKFTIQMTNNELYSTAYDVRRALIWAVQDHWVNHQNSWKDGEKERLSRCKTMFFALARPDLYDDIFIEVAKIFKDFNETQSKS